MSTEPRYHSVGFPSESHVLPLTETQRVTVAAIDSVVSDPDHVGRVTLDRESRYVTVEVWKRYGSGVVLVVAPSGALSSAV